MSKFAKLLLVPFVAVSFAAPLCANAAERINVACSVSVNVTGAPAPETYNKDFTLQSGVAFTDDFSTATRQKNFDAVVAREANNLVVSINYFNDISVFDAVGFSARLTVTNGIASTSGTNDFSSSLAVSRRYVTGYTLTCRKQ